MFTLRRGVKWSDGTPVTAHDYEFAWKRGLDPTTANVNVGVLHVPKNGRVEGFEVAPNGWIDLFHKVKINR